MSSRNDPHAHNLLEVKNQIKYFQFPETAGGRLFRGDKNLRITVAISQFPIKDPNAGIKRSGNCAANLDQNVTETKGVRCCEFETEGV